MTPLVDITLVLLIIFMVTTKIVMNQTVPLDLPKAAEGTSDVQVVFSIIMAADGRAFVDSKPIAERRRHPGPRARRRAGAPRPARGHQGRRRGDPRSRHPRAGSAQAGPHQQDRLRGQPRRADVTEAAPTRMPHAAPCRAIRERSGAMPRCRRVRDRRCRSLRRSDEQGAGPRRARRPAWPPGSGSPRPARCCWCG